VLNMLCAYAFNRNVAQGSLQTPYLDDSVTPMVTGAFTPSDNSVDRGKMS